MNCNFGIHDAGVLAKGEEEEQMVVERRKEWYTKCKEYTDDVLKKVGFRGEYEFRHEVRDGIKDEFSHRLIAHEWSQAWIQILIQGRV